MKGYTLEKIWDPVTRLWHWVLAAVVITGWSFGEFMAFETIRWHFYLGYTVLGLVAFRVIWGLIGPAPIRLSALLVSPRELIDYLSGFFRRTPSGVAGHNPLGALSVCALLLVLLAQAGTGLFIESDDFFEYGPLSHLVSEALVARLTWWHHILAKVVLIVVAIHVLAVLYYLIWKRENLIKPMIVGWKWVKSETENTRPE